ncbi:MAG: RsiV family protein [Spirochaetaceae bacterium]|jgi:hypothetical protein|nr:RsiV family protein [Spirochaetaceae bacterium]
MNVFIKKSLIIVTVLCAACANKIEMPKGAWGEDAERAASYSVYKRAQIVQLEPSIGTRSPRLNFAVELLDSSDEKVKTLLSKTIYDGSDCARYTDERLRDIKKKYLDTKPEAAAINSEAMNWEFLETGRGSVYSNIIVIERLRSMYEGGAHGITEREYFVLDKTAGKRLRLAELIKPANMNDIKKHAEARLRSKYAIMNNMRVRPDITLSSLGFFEDSAALPQDNFFVSPGGLSFIWNPYSIAPYSFGIIEADLPYVDIEPYLSDAGRAVFNSIHKK